MAWRGAAGFVGALVALAACGETFTTVTDPSGGQGGTAGQGGTSTGSGPEGGSGGRGGQAGGGADGGAGGGDGGNVTRCLTCSDAMLQGDVMPAEVCGGTERAHYVSLVACVCQLPGCAADCHGFCEQSGPGDPVCYACTTQPVFNNGGEGGVMLTNCAFDATACGWDP